ncbi:FitA-like ribbon-helix-helix domain-containing protein [Ornithinimicrobium murale]|uniref:FitA-like ribbon-helix-helix domain-containing protein n=1 Tax=Ornithinimicrobium murale TaxID=1050153 RepID=UPI000E0DE77A|nr:hypothetical protein [Ornithinimicrobium murale]
MVALQIRDVPEGVRRVLREQAAARGQSLQALLLRLVTEEAERARNLELLDRFEARADGSQVPREEATVALDRARSQRTIRLLETHEDGTRE